MKRSASLWIVFLMVLSLVPAAKFASALYGTKVIDGNLGDWGTLDLVAKDKLGYGVDGGNLSSLYVSYDDQYLYIALEANNKANWGMAYGIGIDVDPDSGNGYTGTSDAWGRSISFSGNYAIDYELYTWWDDSQAKPTVEGQENVAFLPWVGDHWEYKTIGEVGGSFGWSGDSSVGLKTLEIKIPWNAIGGKTNKIAVIVWVTGGEGSAVDALPESSVVKDNPNEWGDTDYFTDLAEIYIVPKTIDGDLSDWAGYEVVGVSNLDGPDGADLDKLYVSYDEQYLYVAITTNNTASWGVVYGFGFDGACLVSPPVI
ncbi:hypothetical protein GBV73_00370 [Thermococcus sp. 101 C5]|uniref:hypothetical protein n=1 Tax=Thermococcus sp. 101 C5 TaxID=2654197 RepID=UPI00128C5A7F|nr:hypothetical protein [Thermococcus sp. 101 C5]MPW38176.1 hypothetical protein [Thermococcus sp. 101 C5]